MQRCLLQLISGAMMMGVGFYMADASAQTRRIACPPSKGELRLVSNPPATVFLQGKKLGRTPLKVTLETGLNELTLRGSKCADRALRVDVKSRQQTTKTVSLCDDTLRRLDAAKGGLVLVSTPTAYVSRNGEPLGITPLFEKALPVGRHQLQLTDLDGLCTKEVVVEIHENRTTKVRHVLCETAAPKR